MAAPVGQDTYGYAQPQPTYGGGGGGGGAQNVGPQQERYKTPLAQHDSTYGGSGGGGDGGNNDYTAQQQQQSYQQAYTGPYTGMRSNHTNDWHYQIFDCLSPGELCINTCICPCIVYGRTSARLRNASFASLASYDPINHDCFIWYVTSICGLSWIVQMLKRGEARTAFALKGDGVEDCLLSACCTCCALMQLEKEVEGRLSGRPMEMNPRHQYQNHQQYQHQQDQQGYVAQERGMEMPLPSSPPPDV